MATKISLTPKEIAIASDSNSDLTFADEASDQEVFDDAHEESTEDEAVAADLPSEADYFDDEPAEDAVAEPEGSSLPDWLDDDAKAYAESYGLSDEDIQSFSSMDDLERFGQMTDRRVASQLAVKEGPQDSVEEQKPEASDEPEAKDDAGLPSKVVELYDPQVLLDDNYDDTTVGLGKALRQTQEALNALLPMAEKNLAREKQEHEQLARQSEQEFHESLDSLDESVFGTRFDKNGNSRELSVSHKANREAVFNAMENLKGYYAAQENASGKDVTVPQKVLVQRAVAVAFGDVRTRPSSGDTGKLQRQSRKRRPTGGKTSRNHAPVPVSTSADEDVSKIANSPKMKSFWEKAQRENGSL